MFASGACPEKCPTTTTALTLAAWQWPSPLGPQRTVTHPRPIVLGKATPTAARPEPIAYDRHWRLTWQRPQTLTPDRPKFLCWVTVRNEGGAAASGGHTAG